MNATQFELDILKLLNENKQGLACYKIAKWLKKDPSQVFRKLKKLEKKHIISGIGKNPKFYRITFKQNTKDFYEVECPKCRSKLRVQSDQSTALCSNVECKTKTGKRTRFRIYDKRIINVIRI